MGRKEIIKSGGVMETIFKGLNGYPGYMISSDGRIFKDCEEIRQHPNGRGYNKVFLYNSAGEKKSRPVHRLVAEAFIPNPSGLPVVNHKNCNKLDNRVDNLEWVSYQENTQHYLKTTTRETKPIVRINPKTGKVKEVFSSIRIASKCYGYDYRTFYDAIKRGCLYRGSLWKHCTIQIIQV